jgi:phage shock protein B
MNNMVPTVFSVIMLIPLCMIGGFFVIAILLIAKSGKRTQSRSEEMNREAQSVRQLYADLERMEKRIESLETILVDNFKREKAANPVGEPGKAE